MFGNSRSVDILYAFLYYRHLSDNDDIVKVGLMRLALLNTWVPTVLACLEQRVKRGGHKQTLYADNVTRHVSEGGKPSYWTGSWIMQI